MAAALVVPTSHYKIGESIGEIGQSNGLGKSSITGDGNAIGELIPTLRHELNWVWEIVDDWGQLGLPTILGTGLLTILGLVACGGVVRRPGTRWVVGLTMGAGAALAIELASYLVVSLPSNNAILSMTENMGGGSLPQGARVLNSYTLMAMMCAAIVAAYAATRRVGSSVLERGVAGTCGAALLLCFVLGGYFQPAKVAARLNYGHVLTDHLFSVDAWSETWKANTRLLVFFVFGVFGVLLLALRGRVGEILCRFVQLFAFIAVPAYVALTIWQLASPKFPSTSVGVFVNMFYSMAMDTWTVGRGFAAPVGLLMLLCAGLTWMFETRGAIEDI